MTRQRGIFVLGTGTEVGKTVVCAYLTRLLIDQGKQLVPIKPVCSGGRSDAEILHRACREQATIDEINPWWFEEAVTPMVAARNIDKPLKKDVLLAAMKNRISGKAALVEGAGGMMSPIADAYTNIDLAEDLQLPCLLVGVNRLGVINEVLLALSELKHREVHCAGVLLNQPEEADSSSETNPLIIQEMGSGIPVEVIPWLGQNPCEELMFGVNEKKIKKGVELVCEFF